MKTMLRLFFLSMLLSSCAELSDYSTGSSNMSEYAFLSVEPISQVPVGIYEIVLRELTEDDLQSLLAKFTIPIEECNHGDCMHYSSGVKAIKVKAPAKGVPLLSDFKFGEEASSYVLYNYRLGNRYLVDKTVLHFYQGRLALALLYYPQNSLIPAIKDEISPTTTREREQNVFCREGGSPHQKQEKLTQTLWGGSKDALSLAYIQGERVRTSTCQLDPRGQSLIIMRDKPSYQNLEARHRQLQHQFLGR